MSQNDSGHFLISEENWSLHRKGFDDQQRHQKSTGSHKKQSPGSRNRGKHYYV